MKNTYSPDQIQKTGDLNADSIMRQYTLYKVAKFMEIKSNNPRLKQSEIAKLLELSSSTIRRLRREINILSSSRITPSSKTSKKKQKTPNTNLDDVKVTSNYLKKTSNDLKTTSNDSVNNKKEQIESWCKY